MNKSDRISVTLAGVNYHLRPPGDQDTSALKAQYNQLNELLDEVLESTRHPTSDAQAKAVEDKIDQMLRMVGPDLLTIDPPLPFRVKAKVLKFYTDQIAPTVMAQNDRHARKKRSRLG